MAHNEYESDPQMSTTGERLRIARIGKPHGTRGEVTVQLYTDEPTQRLAPGSLLIREPGSITEDTVTATLRISSQRWNKQICLLRFDEVNDRNTAETLRGSMLYIEAAEETGDDDQWYSHQLEGFTCLGPGGETLGAVVELLTGPAQDLLVVAPPEGDDVMVPFVDQLVPDIDAETRTIRLDPPAGLFP